jgi:hypothetical protein
VTEMIFMKTTILPPINSRADKTRIKNSTLRTGFPKTAIVIGHCTALLLTCCNCLSAGDAPVKPNARIVLTEPTTAQALEQKLLEMSTAGGGILLLHKNSSLTAMVHSVTYKHWSSPHALLIPEHVTLDLNGSTLLLDLRSNGYGVRLASHAAIQNGTIRVIRSEQAGSQRIWHSCVSVGAAYGDGGTPETPSYFSKITNWRMEQLTVDQPFPQAAIQIMSEACHGIIRDITISDSAQAGLGVGLDWGTIGPLHMADEKQPEMRRLFDQGKLYATHPHDILIQKIRVGRLTRNENDDDSCAVRTSACYNITIDDVEVQEAAAGIALHAGDAGYEYALEPHRSIGHAGYVIKNVLIHKVYRRGIIIDGISDNIYRSILHHGHKASLSTVTPGIDKPLVKNAKVRGGSSAEIGVFVQFSVGANIEDVDVAEFQKGLHLKDWSKSVTISNCTIHDNGTAMVVAGPASEARPENIVLKKNRIYRNAKTIQAASGQVKEIENVYREP